MHDDHDRAVPASAKLDGIIEQVRADIALGHVSEDVSTVLRQRARDAGIPISDEDLESIASDIEVESSR